MFRRRHRFLIQTHNNPDPDAIGSAVGLRHLYQRYTGRNARIAFGGIVGRAENRAMLRYLKIQMIPGHKVDYRSYDLIAMVDSQPGFRFNPMPEDVVPHLVIDHHPPRADSLPPGVELALIDEDCGAASSILGEIYAASRIPCPEDVASALLYGIKTETRDLGREAAQSDINAYTYLYPLADKRLIAKIESAPVPEHYFQEFGKAIENAVIYDFVVFSDLGNVDAPDMVAEIADFLLRLEGARFSFVMGTSAENHETLFLSLRASEENPVAGRAIGAALGGEGACGGHATMAGGQLPLTGLTTEQVREAKERILGNLLDHLHVKRTLRKDLFTHEPSGGDSNASE